MVNELKAVVGELGGEQVFGRSLATDRDLREAIREGFPPAVVDRLIQASGLTLRELAAALDLSPRSLQRRSSAVHKPLWRRQSTVLRSFHRRRSPASKLQRPSARRTEPRPAQTAESSPRLDCPGCGD